MLKSAHYVAIHLLFKNGHSKRAIAHLTNHDRKTVDKVLRTEVPVLVQRRIRKHKLDAFRKPLEQQLKAGCVTCDQLLSFLRSLGFDGSRQCSKGLCESLGDGILQAFRVVLRC